MDWRAEAIEKLQGYESQRQALDRIPLELERLGAAYTGIRAAKLDGMPRSGSGASDREEAMVANIVYRDDLKRKLKEARLWVEIVEGGLSALAEDEQLVLELLFMRPAKGNIERLCELLCVEKSTVYHRRDEALRRFTIALYGTVESA